jgi:hypothetical protein
MLCESIKKQLTLVMLKPINGFTVNINTAT